MFYLCVLEQTNERTNKQGQLYSGTRRVTEMVYLQQITLQIHFVKVHGEMKNNRAISIQSSGSLESMLYYIPIPITHIQI